MISSAAGKRVDTEITKMCCVFDPDDPEELLKIPHFIGVGWDRKVHIWADEKEEVVDVTNTMPENPASGHQEDIMSVIHYPSKNDLIYTGAHDGTIIAWSMETKTKKYTLHENDPTCTSKDYIRDGKSVDQFLILDQRKNPKLVSMTADQWLRFWNLTDQSVLKPTFKFHCKHPEDDGLTAIATTKDNDYLITGDTSGQMKLWDISEVDLDNQNTENFFLEKYFIIAHRGTINTIQILEEKQIKTGRFIISAS